MGGHYFVPLDYPEEKKPERGQLIANLVERQTDEEKSQIAKEDLVDAGEDAVIATTRVANPYWWVKSFAESCGSGA